MQYKADVARSSKTSYVKPMKRSQKKRVLFFGRASCKNSQSLVELLRELGFTVTAEFVTSRQHKLSKKCLVWSGDYIFSYRCLVKIPSVIIERAVLECINFHPATPKYRGSGGVNWALYNNEKEFGVTVHKMEHEIDSGSILMVDRFKIKDSDNLDTLWHKTNLRMHNVAKTFFCQLDRQGQEFIADLQKKNQSERWQGRLRRIEEVDALEQIKLDCDEDELKRIIRSTSLENRVPYISLHGHRFDLAKSF